MLKRMATALIMSILAALLISSVALAWEPPGQRGYEGQPGNQGGYNQAGQKGYEGQPGNQGGPLGGVARSWTRTQIKGGQTQYEARQRIV